MAFSYSSLRWRRARARAIVRDGNACTVQRLLGGTCSGGSLHGHHIIPVREGGAPYDLANIGTACPAHHPMWEALRANLAGRRSQPVERPVRCRHSHRSREAREICERRMARERERDVMVA